VTKPKKRKPGERIPSNNTKASPAETYVRNLKGEHYLLAEAAEIVGVAKNTLRRLIVTDKVEAPSLIGHLGEMSFYIFTPEDISELKRYYETKYEDFKAGVKLPTGRPRARKE
jgi:hypothetical protein